MLRWQEGGVPADQPGIHAGVSLIDKCTPQPRLSTSNNISPPRQRNLDHMQLRALPDSEQRSTCIWALQLAHTPRPASRLIAVDLAAALLAALPHPFAPECGYSAFMDGSHGPGEEVAAPCSAVLLTLLVKRCEDKVAGE